MMNFLQSLCGCFSPQVKRNIIQYLSSANLNRNLMEQEKTNEEIEDPQQSIYAQVKTKSYYFMKLQEDQTLKDRPNGVVPHSHSEEEQQTNLNELQANFYDENMSLDQLYKAKLKALQAILKVQIGPQYSKVYDSQDELQLKIYCKPQIYQGKRFNSYRFTFTLNQKDHQLTVNDYLNLNTNSNDTFNVHEPLLLSKEKVNSTEGGIEVFHRKYKKVLVINPHELYTVQKAEKVEEEGKESVYSTVFSVKGEWPQLPECSRGWLNLAGLKVMTQHKKQEEETGTSLRQEEEQLCFQGYINCELDISVNANMLKQPVAKQIRVYVQKLICSLIKEDAI